MKQANSYKQCIVKAYNYFAIANGIQWIKPTYKYERKIPLIPTTENVNKIIRKKEGIFVLLYFGNNTLSMTWITPLSVSMSALTMFASLTLTDLCMCHFAASIFTSWP